MAVFGSLPPKPLPKALAMTTSATAQCSCAASTSPSPHRRTKARTSRNSCGPIPDCGVHSLLKRSLLQRQFLIASGICVSANGLLRMDAAGTKRDRGHANNSPAPLSCMSSNHAQDAAHLSPAIPCSAKMSRQGSRDKTNAKSRSMELVGLNGTRLRGIWHTSMW